MLDVSPHIDIESYMVIYILGFLLFFVVIVICVSSASERMTSAFFISSPLFPYLCSLC